jgi:hypothetical protein
MNTIKKLTIMVALLGAMALISVQVMAAGGTGKVETPLNAQSLNSTTWCSAITSSVVSIVGSESRNIGYQLKTTGTATHYRLFLQETIDGTNWSYPNGVSEPAKGVTDGAAGTYYGSLGAVPAGRSIKFTGFCTKSDGTLTLKLFVPTMP